MRRSGAWLLFVFVWNSIAMAQDASPSPEPPALEPGAVEAEPDTPGEATAEDAENAAPEAEAGEAATAEEPASEAAINETPGGDEIVVTGTRLKTSFGASPAPVEVVDRKALERSGAKNMADFIQYTTATQGSGVQGAAAAGPAGAAASALNLRGLGVGATLVLVNGRRLNPSGAATGGAHFGDISTIPMAAVERVEILKAGAAALYGADAVAGVVNVITRRNWDGAKLQIDGQTTSRFDQHEYTGSASFGSIGEHSRLLVAASYFRRSQLLTGQRDYDRTKYYIAPLWPATFYLTAPPMPGDSRRLDPICSSAPAGFCSGQYGQYLPLFPNVERVNAFGSAERDLGEHVMLFGEVGVSRFRGDGSNLPSYDVLTPTIVVPANHIDNPFGQNVVFSGTSLGAPYGAGMSVSADDDFRGVLGLKGDLAGLPGVLASWQWELFTSMGVSRYRESIQDALSDVFQASLNSCSDPAHLENCFNPFYSAVDGTGTPNPQSVVDRFTSRQTLLADHALQTYNLGASGSLFALPGGDAGLAFGGEVRREWRTTEFDHDAQQMRFGFLAGNSNNTARRYVESGYAELRLPFIEGLEVQGAVRVERYTDTGVTSPSPFVGLSIMPGLLGGKDRAPAALRTLQLRANVSTAFRAPTIINTYPGYGTAPLSITYMSPVPAYVPVRYYGGDYVKPETALTISGGLSWAPVNPLRVSLDYWYYDYRHKIMYQNPQLLATRDAELKKMGLPGLSNVIVNTSMPSLLTGVNSYVTNVDGSVTTSGLDFTANVHFDGSDFNMEKNALGLSLTAIGTYTMSFDIPRSLVVSDIKDCEGTADTSPCHVVGKRNYNNAGISPALPRMRANFPLLVSLYNHSFTAIAHYIGSFLDDAPRAAGTAPPTIPAWVTLDLNYGYALNNVIGKRIAATVGCKNVFDLMPPPVNGPAGYFEGQVHDPRGRMFFASIEGEL